MPLYGPIGAYFHRPLALASFSTLAGSKKPSSVCVLAKLLARRLRARLLWATTTSQASASLRAEQNRLPSDRLLRRLYYL